MLKAIFLPWVSMWRTLTFTSSPAFKTSSGFSIRLSAISETWTIPSNSLGSFTIAPKDKKRVTVPVRISPSLSSLAFACQGSSNNSLMDKLMRFFSGSRSLMNTSTSSPGLYLSAGFTPFSQDNSET